MPDSTNDGSYLRRLVQRAQQPLQRLNEQRPDEIAPLDQAEIKTLTDSPQEPHKVLSKLPQKVRNDTNTSKTLQNTQSDRAQEVNQGAIQAPIQKHTSENLARETLAQQVSQPNTNSKKAKPYRKKFVDKQRDIPNDLRDLNSKNPDHKTYSQLSSIPSIESSPGSSAGPTSQTSPAVKKTAQFQPKKEVKITVQRQFQKPKRQSETIATPLAVSANPSPETASARNQAVEASKSVQVEAASSDRKHNEPEVKQVNSLRDKSNRDNSKKTYEFENQTKQKSSILSMHSIAKAIDTASKSKASKAAPNKAQLKDIAQKTHVSKPVQKTPFQEAFVHKNIQKSTGRQVSNNRQTTRNYNTSNKTSETDSLHIGQVNIVVKSSTPDIPAPVRKSQNRSKTSISAPALNTENRRYRKRF